LEKAKPSLGPSRAVSSPVCLGNTTLRTPTRSRRPFSCSPRRADEHASADWFCQLSLGRPLHGKETGPRNPAWLHYLAGFIDSSLFGWPYRLRPPTTSDLRSHAFARENSSSAPLAQSQERQSLPDGRRRTSGLKLSNESIEKDGAALTPIFPHRYSLASFTPSRAHAGPTGPFVFEPPKKCSAGRRLRRLPQAGKSASR
jgi:hypothetical protein